MPLVSSRWCLKTSFHISKHFLMPNKCCLRLCAQTNSDIQWLSDPSTERSLRMEREKGSVMVTDTWTSECTCNTTSSRAVWQPNPFHLPTCSLGKSCSVQQRDWTGLTESVGTWGVSKAVACSESCLGTAEQAGLQQQHLSKMWNIV